MWTLLEDMEVVVVRTGMEEDSLWNRPKKKKKECYKNCLSDFWSKDEKT